MACRHTDYLVFTTTTMVAAHFNLSSGPVPSGYSSILPLSLMRLAGGITQMAFQVACPVSEASMHPIPWWL
jgi:hypothetical protein